MEAYVKIDDMTWPGYRDPREVEYRMRHEPGMLTPGDLMYAASVMAAYRQMILDPESKRREVIRAIRETERGR